jgi:hypothetical protein
MSDISLKGIFGAFCVLVTIGAGVLGLFVSLVVAAVRSASGSIEFTAALKRAIAGPTVCTAVGLLALAWLTQASSNETVDDAGPFVLLAGVLGGVAVGIVVSRRLRRAGAAGASLLILVLLTAPAEGTADQADGDAVQERAGAIAPRGDHHLRLRGPLTARSEPRQPVDGRSG